jgi:glycerol-3-phosphate acyltransferase PlsY
MLFTSLSLIAFAYFCGAMPFGYWAGKLNGIDIRQHGSKNIGATNVTRVLGKKVGIPVFILDVAKGFGPTFFAKQWMENRWGTESPSTLVAVLCAAAAVLGHTYTFWLGFKGGKGVATTAGGLLGLAPLALVIGLVAWLITFYVSRYVALASIVAAVVLPIALAIQVAVEGTQNYVLLGFGVVMGVLVIVRHRSNIARMIAGTENRFGKKKPAAK